MPARKYDEQRPSRPKTAQQVTTKPAKAKQGSWLWLWLCLAGVAVVSATAGALLAVSLSSTPLLQRKLSPQEAAVFDGDSITIGGMRVPELTRPVNILILGMSVLPEDVQNPPPETKNLSYSPQVNSFDGLSDTMLLLRFNPQTRKMIVLSIPRDTRVVLEKYGVQKINAANVSGGPALSAKAVSQLLEGVGIDRYMRINVLGFGKLIDALGGINFYVPRDMKYKDDTQHLYVDLKEGQQRLNGDQAMQLMRFRHDRYGDIGRIQRQQLMMHALMEQALNPATIAKMPKILSVIQSNLDTNLSVEELMALVGFAAKNRSNSQMLVVPGDFNGDGRREVSYWLPNRRRIQGVMAQYFDLGYSDRQIASPASMRVAIQDSTGNPNAVKALVKTLTAAGYPNIFIEERWHEPLRVTRIVAQQGDDRSAQAIQQSLGFGDLRVDSTGSISSDVTIQLGRDWLQRQGSSQNVSSISPGASNQQTLKGNHLKRRTSVIRF